MWTAIWIALIVLSIVLPVYLLYRLFIKLMELLSAMSLPESKHVYQPQPKLQRQAGAYADADQIQDARKTHYQMRANRYARKDTRLEKSLQKWRRYGLI